MNTLKLINEVNDDANGLFPGIDASAFGSKKKAVDIDDAAALEAEHEGLRSRANEFSNMSSRMMRYLESKDAMTYVASGGLGQDEIAYKDFDWLDKYEETRGSLRSYAINKKSPLLNDIEKHIRTLNGYNERSHYYSAKAYDVHQRMKFLVKRANKARRNDAGQAFGPYAAAAPKMAPPKIMPTKLPVAGARRRPIDNPYNTPNAKKKYAGHVAHYPHWSDYWKDQIMQVEDMLKRNGKGGLTTMYASTHDNGGGRFNFVITGANGNLTWRKYDPSPGAGQNWVILDGEKMNMSSLLSANKDKQDKMIQKLP